MGGAILEGERNVLSQSSLPKGERRKRKNVHYFKITPAENTKKSEKWRKTTDQLHKKEGKGGELENQK